MRDDSRAAGRVWRCLVLLLVVGGGGMMAGSDSSRAASAIGLLGNGGSDPAASGSTIDFMILYTPEALARCGQPAMENSILRDECGADLVSMIVARGKYAGLANGSGSYSVYCGNPVVFADEIGHNFGCSHDRGQPRVCDQNGYSYAHTFKVPGSSVTFGTIMSYVGSVILNYSNPSVSFRGCATGIPEGHAAAADNARKVSAAAPEIARRKATRVSSLESPRFDETGTLFSFEIMAPTLETHLLEYTPDFVRWYPLADQDTSGGRATVVDSVGSVGARFYRAHAGNKSPPGIIGFCRVAVAAGSTLIANQLDQGDNAVGRVLRDLPVGCVLHKWDASSQAFIDNFKLASGWSLPEMSLHPGEGAVLDCDQALEITFVGRVRNAFYQATDLGWSLVSSPVPQAGHVSTVLGFPVGFGWQLDRVQKSPDCLLEGGGWTCQNGEWDPEGEPEIGIGRAFWSYQSPNCYIWKRVFLPWAGADTDPAGVVLSVRHGGGSNVVVTAHTRFGGVLQIEASDNLTDWTTLTEVTGPPGESCWADPAGCAQGRRFYRVMRTEP